MRCESRDVGVKSTHGPRVTPAKSLIFCGASLKIDMIAPAYACDKYAHVFLCEHNRTHTVLLSIEVLNCGAVRLSPHRIQNETYCLVAE